MINLRVDGMSAGSILRGEIITSAAEKSKPKGERTKPLGPPVHFNIASASSAKTVNFLLALAYNPL